MPIRTITGRTTLRTQASHGQSEALLKVFQIGLPWLAWFGLSVLGWILRTRFPHDHPLAALLVFVAGSMLTTFDAYMRFNRVTLVGRTIGPVTAASATVMLILIVLMGARSQLMLIYIVGGVSVCIVWGIWLVVGDNRDRAKKFNSYGADNAGLYGTKMRDVVVKQHEVAPGIRPKVITATLELPRGQLTTIDVGNRVENAEASVGDAPGSWSVISDLTDAGQALVRITDPSILDEPIDFPGPSAPGADVSVPFRVGMWQDSLPMLHQRLPVHHIQGMGCVGSGKTMSWPYNEIAEGVTREGYAAFGWDITKGEQYLGAMRPMLHGLALDPEEAIEQFKAIERARVARTAYLGKNRMTEWKPGCGLTFLDLYLEEAPDLYKLMNPSKSLKNPDELYLLDWMTSARGFRSAGMALNQSYQRTDYTQQPTVLRAQQGNLCFGVMNKQDADFGLSELQRERGARPWMWGASVPGKALIDTLTVNEDYKTMPLRFFTWGRDNYRMAAYAGEWQARDRPLDDVTGEALEDTPGRSPSSAFPLGAPVTGEAQPDRKPPQAEAVEVVRQQITQWRAGGRRSFVASDLYPVVGQAGRQRTWIYQAMLIITGSEDWVRMVSEVPKMKWEIDPLPEDSSDA